MTRPSPHFAAAQWLDLVWPVLLLLGVEKLAIVPSSNPFLNLRFLSYPYTHSLLVALVWWLLFAAVYAWRRGHRIAAAWLGAAVVSHWVLDFISHQPDLALAPWLSARVGLGLWNYPGATVAAEAAMLAVGVWIYARTTRPRDAAGRWGFWGLVAFLVAVYTASLVGTAPPSTTAIALSGLGLWLLVLWAAWCDRHRELRRPHAA